jgi:hypothetical protein
LVLHQSIFSSKVKRTHHGSTLIKKASILQNFALCSRWLILSTALHFPGNWIGATDLSHDSFEKLEENLKGENKVCFLQFVRKMVRWKPEERSSASDLLNDTWLNDTRMVS